MASKELEQSVALQREMQHDFVACLSPRQLRATFSRYMARYIPDRNVRFEPVMAGDVPVEWMVPPDVSPHDTLMHFHGGGYIFGCPIDYRETCSRMAKAAGARALVVDYRLTPENPCPAPLEDCVAAYKWHLANGGRPERTVFTGDSAGGTLVFTTMVALREEGVPLPAGAVAISPWGESEMLGDSIKGNADVDPLVSEELLRQMAASHLQGQDPRQPAAAPIYSDMTGLPPLLIQVGSIEVLLDDAKRLADKAKADGVEVAYEVTEGAPHVWHWYGSFVPEAREAIERLGEFSRKRFAAAGA